MTARCRERARSGSFGWVRSCTCGRVNGPEAAWYRSTRSRHQGRLETGGNVRDVTWVDVDATEHPDIDPAVDAEYARKYRGSTSAIAHINSPEARVTTMRVDPR